MFDDQEAVLTDRWDMLVRFSALGHGVLSALFFKLVHYSACPAGGAPLSKRQQKKQMKKQLLKQGKLEKKAAKKEQNKAAAALKRKEMDERVQNMTPKEREAYRQKSHAVGQV